MKIVKRNGGTQKLSFDKITQRLRKCITEETNIDLQLITQEVSKKLIDNVTTTEIDGIIIETLTDHFADDTIYDKLATSIYVSRLHKSTPRTFTACFQQLHAAGVILDKYWNFVKANRNELNTMINRQNDYKYGYFGMKTVERHYLLNINGKIMETPQYMLMRVAIQLYYNSKEALLDIRKCYNTFSSFLATPATPTIINSCTPNGNLASCYLFSVSDSLKHIMITLEEQAMCSKVAGGLGMSITDVRSKGSVIGSTGVTDGVIPMLKMYNSMISYVNQQQKRNGSLAVYLEPWHPEIEDFIRIRTTGGDENLKCRKLFPALWMPDLFYKKLLAKEEWYLIDPKDAPELTTTYGEEFEIHYNTAVAQNRYRKKWTSKQLQDFFLQLVLIQSETGSPYIVNKDHVNRKSNQKHIGTIKNSNLCAEICLVANEEEIGVCNLSSISLPHHIRKSDTFSDALVDEDECVKEYDFEALGKTTRQLVRNLNAVIDNTEYFRPDKQTSEMERNIPKKAEKCNQDHRPIAIGIQGLADTFAIMRYSWDSPEAKRLNKNIMRTIYYYAMLESNIMAEEYSHYKTFPGSPLSKGLFQFDMCEGFDYDDEGMFISKNQYDTLRDAIVKNGTFNSMLTALMPTATSSQILNNTECFDPFHSNLYVRQTLAGNITLLNRHLVKDLKFFGLWDNKMKKEIMAQQGSIQNIPTIPLQLKKLYKTAWEVTNQTLIQFAADRSPYVDHSQSMNLYYQGANSQEFAKNMIMSWRLGLKTGLYYARNKEAVANYDLNVTEKIEACTIDNPDCDSCGA